MFDWGKFGIKNPYYADENICVIYEDCREIMPQFSDKLFDLCLTDFPYGNDTQYDGYEDTQENLKELITTTMPLILVKSKRALITCGVANIQLYPKSDWILSWINPAGTGLSCWGFCCWQPILAYGKDPYLQNGLGRQLDIIVKNEISLKFIDHPCPKPIDFWQLLMKRGSIYEGEVILDCFGGSGTTAIAARKLNRKAVIIEISKKSCDEIVKRLAQSVMSFDFKTE
ncbi:MAG: DNA methyltransferase [Lutibacter sp.]|jgi:DNA modification methylase